MAPIYLQRPMQIIRRSGWTEPFRFFNGLPPTDVPDDLTGYKAVATLVPISQPESVPIELSTDAGTIDIQTNTVSMLVGRGVNAYWPEDNYDFMLRVFRDADLTDRYVVRSHPNKSPVKVIAPAGGNTPIPGGGSNIVLPLSFTDGYAPGEVLPGYPLVDLVVVKGSSSKFQTLTRPTNLITQIIRLNTVEIGVATMDPATCGAGPVFNGTVVFTSDPMTLASGGYLDWTAPAAIDPTYRGGAVSLAGN